MSLLEANESCLVLLQSYESMKYLKHCSLDQAVFNPDKMSNDRHLPQNWGSTPRHRLPLSRWQWALLSALHWLIHYSKEPFKRGQNEQSLSKADYTV